MFGGSRQFGNQGQFGGFVQPMERAGEKKPAPVDPPANSAKPEDSEQQKPAATPTEASDKVAQ